MKTRLPPRTASEPDYEKKRASLLKTAAAVRTAATHTSLEEDTAVGSEGEHDAWHSGRPPAGRVRGTGSVCRKGGQRGGA